MRMTFFWFEFSGALFVILGSVMLGVDRRGTRSRRRSAGSCSRSPWWA